LKSGGWPAVDELGSRPELRPNLEVLANGKDAEASWWAVAALDEIEARERAGGAAATPLRVTLDARERPVEEVVKAILSRMGCRLVEWPKETKKVTVSFKDTLLLDALRDLARLSGLKMARRSGMTFRLEESEEKPPRGPTFLRGAFGVSLVSMLEETVAAFKEEPKSRLEIAFFVEGDPRVRILGTVKVRVHCAVDDTGKSLVPPKSPPAPREVPETPTLLSLEVPARQARKIALLRGEIEVKLAAKTEELVFDDLQGKLPQRKESGGVSAVLRKFEFDEREYDAELALSFPGGAGQLDFEAVLLEDAVGKSYGSQEKGMTTLPSGVKEEVVSFQFVPAGFVDPPTKLRIPIDTGLYSQKIPFEFRDIVIR
jgi:hypothetical protein